MKLQITIDGKAYDVEVEVLEEEESPPAASYVPYRATHTGAERALSYGGMWDAHGKVCHSPVTGLVIGVNVQPGIVKSVHVAPGDSVKMNQVLAEFE